MVEQGEEKEAGQGVCVRGIGRWLWGVAGGAEVLPAPVMAETGGDGGRLRPGMRQETTGRGRRDEKEKSLALSFLALWEMEKARAIWLEREKKVFTSSVNSLPPMTSFCDALVANSSNKSSAT